MTLSLCTVFSYDTASISNVQAHYSRSADSQSEKEFYDSSGSAKERKGKFVRQKKHNKANKLSPIISKSAILLPVEKTKKDTTQ